MRALSYTTVAILFAGSIVGLAGCQDAGGDADSQSSADSQTSDVEEVGPSSDDDEPTAEQLHEQQVSDLLAPFLPSGPPENYGHVSPSHPAPPPESLTVHGLAGYEVVAIYDAPDLAAPKLGYLRIGQRFMVTPRVEGTGCEKGWHQLESGGFACASKGLVVDEKRPPYMFRAPPPPRLDQPLPFDYAYVRESNVPMWWRVPTDAELATARAFKKSRAPKDPAVVASTTTSLPTLPDPLSDPSATMTETPSKGMADPKARLPLNPDTPWLEKGFYISLAEQLEDKGRLWWRTARGGYVEEPYAKLWTPKDFKGTELPDDITFPFGFVMVTEGSDLLRVTETGALESTELLPKRSFIDLMGEVEIDGKLYYVTHDSRLIKAAHVRLAEPQPVPEGLALWERWIDVSLDKQMLIAYEGPRPVFVTLVSTGKPGFGDKDFETPTGRWRIRSKHVSSTMDGDTASDGSYSIQDVPWTMFFDGSIALHGAFWHDGFGRVRSHGCVNLGPSDAHWLFQWTTPVLPEGWHGVHAHAGAPGTTVVVRKKPPEEPVVAAG